MSASIYVERANNVQQQKRSGNMANAPFFPCILLTCWGCNIPRNMKILCAEQQTKQWSTRIPCFLAALCKRSDAAPNANCPLCASCAWGCVRAAVLKTSCAESCWKSFPAPWCWQTLQQQSHGKICCQRAGREGNCFLPRVNGKEFFFSSLCIP